MEVKGREPVLMLEGKAANRALPEREGRQTRRGRHRDFFYTYFTGLGPIRDPRLLEITCPIHFLPCTVNLPSFNARCFLCLTVQLVS